MAEPAHELHSLLVQLSAEEIAWLRARAERNGVDEAEALVQLLRRARDREERQWRAREELLAYLGDAARLESGDEEEIRRELYGDD